MDTKFYSYIIHILTSSFIQFLGHTCVCYFSIIFFQSKHWRESEKNNNNNNNNVDDEEEKKEWKKTSSSPSKHLEQFDRIF